VGLFLTVTGGIIMRHAKHHNTLRMLLFSSLLLLHGCNEAPTIEGLAHKPAPDFSMTLFNGDDFQLSAQKGKVVMINFFASWCVSCGAEIHHIQNTFKAYAPKNVTFLGIAIDDTEKKARAFMQQHDLTYPAGMDNTGHLKEIFGLYGMPTTFFIDKNGMVSYFHAGVVTEALLRHEIDKLL